MLNRKRSATPLGGKELYGGQWRERLFGGRSGSNMELDLFARARFYVEKLDIFGLDESRA